MYIPSSYFIFIDCFIGLIFITFIIFGFKKGFIFELISLIYTALSLVISWFISPIFANLYPIIKLEELYPKSEIINKVVNLDVIINTITYFVIIFLVLKLFYILLSFFLKGMNKIPVLGTLNRLLGGVIGIFNAALITILLSILLTLPLFKNGKEIKNGTLFKYVNIYTEKVLDIVVDRIDFDHIKQQFSDFDVDDARTQLQEWIESNSSDE